MGKELIYRDDARRALLKSAPNAAWCLDRVKTVMVVEDEKLKPQTDEFWVARIEYWPKGGKDLTVVLIHYVWEDGAIDFVPFGEDDPICSTQCAQFELLERIKMEKYK